MKTLGNILDVVTPFLPIIGFLALMIVATIKISQL